MQGSKPERRISFLPLRDDFMALAVSSDDLAATRLTNTGQPVAAPLPSSPLWLSVPGATLRQPGLIPPGMKQMLSALASADRVVIDLGPVSGGIEARLDAACRTKDDASVLASQLRTTAGLIREGIGNKIVAPDDELARMLAAGSFNQTGAHVVGRWPVAKGLLDSLTAGL
jgi:hypothetical protein